MDDQFDSKTETFLKWLNHVGVQISAKAELTDLRADGRGRALGMWLLSRCFPTFCGYCMQYDKNVLTGHYHIDFVLRIPANYFLSRQGRFCRRRVDLQRPSNKHLECESGITGITIGQTRYFG